MQVQWRRSTRCASNACIEVGKSKGFLVRDSKDMDSPVLEFDNSSWANFIMGLKNGKLASQPSSYCE